MPTDIQSLLVYLIVLCVVAFLIRRLLKSIRGRHSCGDSCSCSRDGVKRNPVIDQYLKKQRKNTED